VLLDFCHGSSSTALFGQIPYNSDIIVAAVSRELSSISKQATDNSDQTLLSLLERLKTATDPETVRRLSEDIERTIFHKQLENA
jgi:hypothetical protein